MPLPAINIRALRAFIAVYEEQSFSRAAHRENATQSGMSTQVKNLEDQLGTPLLVRERKALALTPAGEIVYRNGQAILRLMLATEGEVEELARSVSGQVRFGMIPSLTRSVLIAALAAFKTDFPGVETSLVEEYSYSLMRRVLDGEIEFAVVPGGDVPAGLSARYVGRDREMVVSRPGTLGGVSHLAPVPLSVLNGRPLIVPSLLNIRRKAIDSTLGAHRVHPSEMLEMDGMLATLEMLAVTDFVAILPSAICHSDKPGGHRQLNVLADPPMTIDYIMVQRADAVLSRAAQLLADRVVDYTNRVLSDWEDLPTEVPADAALAEYRSI
jgi:DNA-binding transcriptional LysR family regulator